MHVFGFIFDFSFFLRFIFTAIAVSIAILHLVKKTASKYFTVDDPNFDEGGADAGANSSQMIAGARCAVCGTFATKHCAGCKTVRYCSAACQSKHWRTDHKLICKKLKLNASRRENASGNNPRTELQQLKKVLFPYEEFVRLFNWENQGFPPCGLLNCGNSCFANVVLQCLSCTRPLVAYLLERGHQRECRRNDWCFLCELQSHVERARILRPFSPINILSRLPNIGGNLGYGKQEDAHEFMRFAIDTMQSVCLDEFGGEKALHSSSQETTVIQYTFGGYLQSQVTCTKCKKISDRYENMMDLTVEIQGDAESLEECLDQFTAEEWLDGENMYKCDGCNDYVKACKRLTIHMAPNILTIALKRFQSGRYGKLNKRVTFPETLDLRPYMSKPGDGTDLYQLYAVVVHVDMLNASFFGHYICYMKDFCGNWYRVDDCKVMTVELEEVLAQGAYMLLYNRMSVRPPCVNLLETLGKEDKHPGEVVKEAELCLPETLKPPVAIEGSIISITEGDMVSDLGYLAEESVSKEDSLRMDLDSSTDNNDKVKSSSQDAIDMDVDESIEVDPMSDRVDQVDLALGNRDPSSLESNGSCDNENLALRNPDLSALESNGFDDDEKLDYRVTVSASSAENFHSGVSGSVPPSVVTPWTGVHSLECDEVKSIPQDSLPTDLEESIEVNPMSARGGKVELGLGSPECSPSDSKSSGDDEKQHSHTVRTASSANHFQCREDSLPLTELIPSPSYHNFTGVERINNEEFMPPEISLDTCLSGQTDVQEIASCSLPPSSETGILHERNPSNFQSLPNPMAEQAIMVEPIKIEGRTSKLPKGNSFSQVKLKPVFSSGFLNNQTKCGSANVTRKVPERCGEGGLVKVGNNCNGFTKVGVVADENVSKVNGHNKFSDYDSLPNCGSIDNKPESCLNGGQIMDRDLGDDGCIGSCRVVEMASPAKLLLERVESSDVECTSGGRNGSWKSCEETMPPECNGFSPNESNNENDRTCYMDPVGASASDTEMLDKPNLGLEMATVESGNVFHPLRVSSEENGNYSCSKMTLNPPPPPIVEDDSQMEFGEVGHVSKGIDSNGLANSGVHLKSIHIYDHDKGPSEGGNAKKSVCNGNGWKPVNICESKKTSQKGYLSRGFLDKPQKKLVKKDDGYENEKIRNSNLTQEAVLEDRNSVFSPGFLDKPLLRKKLPEQRIESLGGTKETFVSDQERNKMPWVVEH